MKYSLLILVSIGILFIAAVSALLPKSTRFEYVDPAPVITPTIKNVSVILGGDVMLGRTVMTKSMENGDGKYPFSKIAKFMSEADITFINLENPIFEGCPLDETGASLIFCASTFMMDGLIASGVDVVSIANNHIKNYGNEGFENTKKTLQQRGIKFVGDGNLAIFEIENMKFGFLAFDKSQQVFPKLTDKEVNLITISDQQVDILIVSMHWGVEYQSEALPGVQELAEELVTLGADVVVGHHPHWVQNVDYIDGKPVYYSLGNLVFDQMWSEQTRSGLLVKLVFEEGELIKEELIKTYMDSWAQPIIVN